MQIARRQPGLVALSCALALAAGVLAAWAPGHATGGESGSSEVSRIANAPPDAEVRASRIRQENPAFAVLDDEFLGEQWGLFNWGQTIGAVEGESLTGVADADIRAPEAWAVTRGSRDVVVAVIDTGVDYAHPDLAANMWTNAGETGDGREDNGLDDDGNGYVDDWRGWDFLDGDNDPRDELSSIAGGASIGHGTAVASVLGAVGGNGIGISGVAPEVSIMPLRVAGAGSVSDIGAAEAIDYAAANGARIVNISIVSGVPNWPNRPVSEAIARHPEVLFVVSAGNQGQDVDILNLEPCSQRHDNIVCVGASDARDALARWIGGAGGSNWGAETVDLLAPGVAIAVAAPSMETLFEDTFEGSLDESRWASEGGWDVEGGRLVDSPGGPHSTGRDTWVQMTSPVDLEGRAGCWLVLTGVSTDTAGATMVLTEMSDDGVRWSVRMGQGSLASVASTAIISTASTTASQSVPYVYMPLAEEQDAPFYLRLRLRPSLGPTHEAGDGVSIDDIRVECLATPEASASTRGAYGFAQGTSFSSPHVAGAAALVLAAYPDLSPLEVKRALLEGSASFGRLDGRVASGGRLDAAGALAAAAAIAGVPPAEASRTADAIAAIRLDEPSDDRHPAGGLMGITWGHAGSPPDARPPSAVEATPMRAVLGDAWLPVE